MFLHQNSDVKEVGYLQIQLHNLTIYKFMSQNGKVPLLMGSRQLSEDRLAQVVDVDNLKMWNKWMIKFDGNNTLQDAKLKKAVILDVGGER